MTDQHAASGSPPLTGELRVGLIGAGKMGINHLKAIASCTGVRLVGVADPQADPEQLRPLLPADAVIVPTTDALFSQARPDVVHIVTPPRSHGAIGAAALAAGAHIYVEKPFTLTRADAEPILADAAARGRRVCAGHQCLFEHGAIAGRRALPALGTIVHIESYFSFRTVRRSISPVDQAKDILPHAVYMLVDYLRAANPALAKEPIELRGVDVSADGGIYGVVALGPCRGLLIVTLAGRPVEQYLHAVGSNGSMRVDLVSDAVTKLAGPGASAVAALMGPYRLALQGISQSTRGFYGRIRERKYGYPGHRALCQAFYDSIRLGSAEPMTPGSILETVGLCEAVGVELDRAEQAAEATAAQSLASRERNLPVTSKGLALVTGAAGFLGRRLVRELRQHGWAVRALTRQPLRLGAREPGVEYRAVDLASPLAPEIMQDVTVAIHCAAETKGGKADQERNSVRASKEMIEAAARAGVKQFVHVSSVAVMRPPASGPMDEATPVDFDTLERGPYVWGKAESERIVATTGQAHGVGVRIVRLGPLVDFAAFEPPGRLGRELGPFYAAVGPKRRGIALCDLGTAAEVLRAYADDFDSLPPVLNLLEPDAPSRRDLAARLRAGRADLRIFWVPMWFLKLVSPPLKLVQRLLLGAKTPLDIASAFTSPVYRTELAGQVISRAKARAAGA